MADLVAADLYEPAPNATVILYSLKDRSDEELQAKFSQYGTLLFLRGVTPANCAIIAYQSAESAQKAISECSNEELFLSEDAPDSLELPKHHVNWLTSPPPSPPEGWKPLHEDINRISHGEDIQEVPITKNRTLLLERSASTPRIIVQHDE